MIKLLLGVVGGFLVWTILWLGSNAGLSSAFPLLFAVERATTLASMVVLLLSMLMSLIAGWLAARIAQRWQAVWILSLLQVVAGLIVTVLYWQAAALWYHLLFIAFLVPVHLLGAYVALKHPFRGG